MSLIPSAPRSIGGVLDDAIRLYRKSLSSCLPLTLVAAVILAIPGLILGRRMLNVAAGGPQAMLALMKSPSYSLSYLAIMLIYTVFYCALISNINTIAHGGQASISNALIIGLKRLFPTFMVSVFFLLMIVIGIILLIIPGIYLWGIFQLAFTVLIVENTGIFESFGISRRLIKGHWWRSATILTVALIIMIVFALIAGIIGGALVGMLRLDLMSSLLIQQNAGSIVKIFTMTLIPSVMLAMYYDLKLRNEGTDLAERIDALPAVS
jgi:hypothetical protein